MYLADVVCQNHPRSLAITSPEGGRLGVFRKNARFEYSGHSGVVLIFFPKFTNIVKRKFLTKTHTDTNNKKNNKRNTKDGVFSGVFRVFRWSNQSVQSIQVEHS